MNGRIVVAILAGLDPTGGAGLAADILAVNAAGAHAVPILTANTIQGPSVKTEYAVTDFHFFRRQLATAIKTMNPGSLKLGMAGSPEIVSIIRETLDANFPLIPLIVDPIQSASSGGSLSMDGMRESLISLAPVTLLITPNRNELGWLTQQKVHSRVDLLDAVMKLGGFGFKNILVKGGHFEGDPTDYLFIDGQQELSLTGKRYKRVRRGTGCSLASHAAAGMAKGLSVARSVRDAYDHVQKLILLENTNPEDNYEQEADREIHSSGCA